MLRFCLLEEPLEGTEMCSVKVQLCSFLQNLFGCIHLKVLSSAQGFCGYLVKGSKIPPKILMKSLHLITFNWFRLGKAFENHSPLHKVETNMLLESPSIKTFLQVPGTVLCVYLTFKWAIRICMSQICFLVLEPTLYHIDTCKHEKNTLADQGVFWKPHRMWGFVKLQNCSLTL